MIPKCVNIRNLQPIAQRRGRKESDTSTWMSCPKIKNTAESSNNLHLPSAKSKNGQGRGIPLVELIDHP